MQDLNNLGKYNDSKDRSIVKDFFKRKFNEIYVDTPDSVCIVNGVSYCRHRGSYDFDLIDKNIVNGHFKFIEIEKVPAHAPSNIWDHSSNDDVWVQNSKYWKYFHDTDKNYNYGYLVYLKASGFGDTTTYHDEICVIKSYDIKNAFKQVDEIFKYQNSTNKDGHTWYFKIPKSICHFYKISTGEEFKISSANKVCYINVSNNILNNYWTKGKANYSIPIDYDKYDEISFQNYDKSFNPCGRIVIPTNCIEKSKLNNFGNGYYLFPRQCVVNLNK